MNVDMKAKWVAALRSGKYAQSKGKLRGSEGYCCLGVLCDVVDPAGWSELNEPFDGYFHQTELGMPTSDILRHAVLGLTSASMAASMNDTGSTFEDIAAWIERTL